MSNPVTYLVPVDSACVEQEVKRSRFIARLGRAPDRQAALAFIETARREDSGADHHCWAFIAGNPADSGVLGMSDDGEPSGTAGRPMLNLLQHSGLGEVVAVISRYYGGIKLGTGGLVRAYSGTLRQALAELPSEPFVESTVSLLTLPFTKENAVRWLLAELHLEVSSATYGDGVTLTVAVPNDQLTVLEEKLCNCCQGRSTMGTADCPAREDK